MDDLIFKEFDRPDIDKFGNPIDKNKVGSVDSSNKPFFSHVSYESEENMEEDDEEGRWMRIMQELK